MPDEVSDQAAAQFYVSTRSAAAARTPSPKPPAFGWFYRAPPGRGPHRRLCGGRAASHAASPQPLPAPRSTPSPWSACWRQPPCPRGEGPLAALRGCSGSQTCRRHAPPPTPRVCRRLCSSSGAGHRRFPHSKRFVSSPTCLAVVQGLPDRDGRGLHAVKDAAGHGQGAGCGGAAGALGEGSMCIGQRASNAPPAGLRAGQAGGLAWRRGPGR